MRIHGLNARFTGDAPFHPSPIKLSSIVYTYVHQSGPFFKVPSDLMSLRFHPLRCFTLQHLQSDSSKLWIVYHLLEKLIVATHRARSTPKADSSPAPAVIHCAEKTSDLLISCESVPLGATVLGVCDCSLATSLLR